MKIITRCRQKDLVDLKNFSVSDIDIRDIAWALAGLPRYGGHGNRFYSVAQHCIRVVNMVPEKYRFEALMHDASEAYLGDVVGPLKRMLPDYRAIESRIQAVICNKYRLPVVTSEVVETADKMIRKHEIFELFEESSEPLATECPNLMEFVGMSQKGGASLFLTMFEHLSHMEATR